MERVLGTTHFKAPGLCSILHRWNSSHWLCTIILFHIFKLNSYTSEVQQQTFLHNSPFIVLLVGPKVHLQIFSLYLIFLKSIFYFNFTVDCFDHAWWTVYTSYLLSHTCTRLNTGHYIRQVGDGIVPLMELGTQSAYVMRVKYGSRAIVDMSFEKI